MEDIQLVKLFVLNAKEEYICDLKVEPSFAKIWKNGQVCDKLVIKQYTKDANILKQTSTEDRAHKYFTMNGVDTDNKKRLGKFGEYLRTRKKAAICLFNEQTVYILPPVLSILTENRPPLFCKCTVFEKKRKAEDAVEPLMRNVVSKEVTKETVGKVVSDNEDDKAIVSSLRAEKMVPKISALPIVSSESDMKKTGIVDLQEVENARVTAEFLSSFGFKA